MRRLALVLVFVGLSIFNAACRGIIADTAVGIAQISVGVLPGGSAMGVSGPRAVRAYVRSVAGTYGELTGIRGGAGRAQALSRGSIGSTLEGLTRDMGLREAAFRINEQGIITRNFEVLGKISNDGMITRGNYPATVIGRIQGNIIYEPAVYGRPPIAVGEINARAVVPATLRWGEGLSRSIEPGVRFRLMRYQSGWFNVRLEDGATGWLPGNTLGFSLITTIEEGQFLKTEVVLSGEDESDDAIEAKMRDVLQEINKILNEK